MLNSLEAAVETLEEAGALLFEITQPGSFKSRGEEADTQKLIDKFLTVWDRLVPGIYLVHYSKSPTDKRSNLCFRVSKTQSAAGSPAQLAGVDNDRLGQLQVELYNLRTDAQLQALEAKHREELRAVTEKNNGGMGGLDATTVLAGLDKIHGMMSMYMGKPTTAAVSGPAPARALPPGPALAANETALATALETLETVLGGDELVAALAKLAAKGQHNPDGLRKALGYIDLL